jgi:hypothetical protein
MVSAADAARVSDEEDTGLAVVPLRLERGK